MSVLQFTLKGIRRSPIEGLFRGTIKAHRHARGWRYLSSKVANCCRPAPGIGRHTNRCRQRVHGS